MSSADPADLRREILRALYLRRAAALSSGHLATILTRKTGEPVTPGETLNEIKFLTGMSFVEAVTDPLGSTTNHNLTPDGLLYCERNDLTD